MFSEHDINRYNYRLRFQEMENKIKKCEIERSQLEHKFSQLMRERQECEKAAERSLKLKYKRMMELERQRSERNETLLRMLHKVDQQAASLASKSNRLKMLKEQYESYLIRSWSTQQAISSSPRQQEYYLPLQSTSDTANANSFQFPPRVTNSPKSEFVKYITDTTYLSTADSRAIPPPMALSNFISHQQQETLRNPISRQLFTPQSNVQTTTPFPTEYHPPSQSQNPQNNTTPISYRSTAVLPSNSRKNELSNEEFIRYVDDEILKGSVAQKPSTTETPSIVVDPPSQPPATKYPTAYLEDFNEINENDGFQSSEVNYDDCSPMIEELVDATEQLNLDSDAVHVETEKLTLSQEESTPAVFEEGSNNNFNSIVEPSRMVENQKLEPTTAYDSPQQPEPVRAQQPLHGVVEQTLLGMISEVEENFVTMPVSEDINLAAGTAAPEAEIQQDYSEDGNYQLQYTMPENANYQPSDVYQEGDSTGCTEQEIANDDYSFEQGNDEQPAALNSSYWSTAIQAVKSKTYNPVMPASETIEEVTSSNDRQSPVEKRITPPESKRSTPLGRNMSSANLEPVPEHEPIGAVDEQLAESVDPAQTDYDQYQQEYLQNPEQYTYQYDQETVDPYYSQPLAEQTNQEESQGYYDQENVENGGTLDPNQYQQATEYPGPTQYVFEQGFYEEQQPDPEQQQQQYDPNQQEYYDPNQQNDQQYYTEEESTQLQQQEVYDQTQFQQYNVNSEHEQSAQEGTVTTRRQEEESPAPLPADMETPTVADADRSTKVSDKVESKPPPQADHTEEKHDTTLSSVNEDSDFDFSTQ
ncbi:uncharacterized protein LOC129731263 [Wyeomyia smithii]|uniref:uncharacterized protein LOC129731263 n=1 Tax=Wyeomyia smithii TaxID=174621 RepID=UPI0024681B51|nr:uncharacterized protein LOC129731263 [Wyeomyia smithii]XP_055547106.1 uncharacterized protein LOC129731263 [Wyeomyia smithii]XP_055547114.1 uncharacterized protein LOC129731263 [Wyeomyia smithii]XP_055547121.1 uncharacterized protein LOC129731263 [Wyeomyia smithii]XP_055547129.1 uncharacterized protein LOC129731263 [Wyeomyia smithii]XP_055547135.1 uncharacterized protein LOC129731263 [Wyeomyia smithii]